MKETYMQLKCYFLVGPTAVGKSSVAQYLAEKRGAAILSADSMLIYRGMDIGTATPTAEERGDVEYYGINLVAPDQKFSVWDYRQHALNALEKCLSEGKEVIVAGGTGLYVKSLTHGLENRPGEDRSLRDKWEKQFKDDGIKALQDALRKVDPVAYELLVDKENPRRLIRALESVGSKHNSQRWTEVDTVPFLVGLYMEPELLNERIARRVEIMYNDGLIAEVEGFLSQDSPMSVTAMQGIGYAEAIDFIEGRLTQKEAMERTVVRTRRLAKRQRTWFRNQAKVEWIYITPESKVEEIAMEVEMLWKEHGPTNVLL